MTLIEKLNQDLAEAKQKVMDLEQKIQNIPSEFHQVEESLFAKLMEWLGK